jgi:hypothetical protein
VLQRCPKYTAPLFEEGVRKPDVIELLVHDDGVTVPALANVYKNTIRHDPRDLDGARRLAEAGDRIRLGVFFRDESRPRYEDIRRLRSFTAEEKIALLEEEMERHAV